MWMPIRLQMSGRVPRNAFEALMVAGCIEGVIGHSIEDLPGCGDQLDGEGVVGQGEGRWKGEEFIGKKYRREFGAFHAWRTGIQGFGAQVVGSLPKLEPEIRGGDGAVGEVGDFDEFMEVIRGEVDFVEEDVAGIGQ